MGVISHNWETTGTLTRMFAVTFPRGPARTRRSLGVIVTVDVAADFAELAY
jgi:hypothetical protein